MKISDKLISIPPYISTSWVNVSSLYMEGAVLNIILKDGKCVQVPELGPDQIATIFGTHASLMEQEKPQLPILMQPMGPSMSRIDIPFRLGVADGEEFGSSIFAHDASKSDLPEIPAEILQKIISITEVVTPNVFDTLPKSEPNCHCVHCQIIRSFESRHPVLKETLDEQVSDADLTFQPWQIQQVGDQLYQVSNQETNEIYRVYLGDPMGCTCGQAGCEHIVAVLKS